MAVKTVKINKRVKELLDSATLAITAKAKELKAEGHDVVNFAAGEPDFDTPQPIKDAAIKALAQGHTKYTPSVGTVELRRAIAEKFKKDNNLEYKPSQIVVSCGAKHAIFNVIQVLADEGEEVLLPSPYWVSYPEMIKLAGAKMVTISTDSKTNFKITPQLLNKAITKKSKILILNSPSNPTGMVYTKEELAPIAEICIKKGIYVISDEIYEKLVFDTDKYSSIASLGKEIYEQTITINGVSKTYAMTGWRIGYLAGNQEIIDYVKKLQDHTTSNPTTMCQIATIEALRTPEAEVTKMRNIFKERRDLIVTEISKIPEISFVKPQGAFYLFCNFSKLGLGDSFSIAKKILEEVYVAMIPGEGFDAPGYMRLSYATSNERIKEGIKRIAQWIKHNK